MLKVAIVGGGLAGLGSVIALTKFGVEAELFEAASTLKEVGAGINTSPQAVKALTAIGLGEKLAKIGNRSGGTYTRNMQTGEFIDFSDRTKVADQYGAPYYTYHRADLLEALAGSVEPARVHLDHRLAAIEEKASSVALTFQNGKRVEAEVVVAADGIHSVIRRALYGEDSPTYTGQMVWRALLNGRDVPSEVMQPSGHLQWVGAGCHLLAYYLRGTEVINIVTQEDTEKWVEEGWSTPGDPDEMRLSFPNPEPRLKTILATVTKCSKWGLFTRPLSDNWGRGRIQLIGDAAHAMLPNAGQGACMAFEDSYTLARWLDAKRNDPVDAFREFRRVRIPRVHGVQRTSFAYAKMKHMRDRDEQKARFAHTQKGRGMSMDWIWRYDPVQSWDKTPDVPDID